MGKQARIRQERRKREREQREREFEDHALATGQQVQRISFEEDDFLPVDLVRSDLRAAVVPVVVRDPHGLRPLGTAFCVSAGLPSSKAIYVTARHVVDGIVPEVEKLGEGFHEVPAAGHQEPFLLIPQDISTAADSRALMGTRIEQFSLPGAPSDIATMRVDLSEFTVPQSSAIKFALTLAEPTVGETCLALGYPGMAVGEQVPDDPNTMGWNGPLHASQATIQEVHPAGRDRSMLPFPCFRTSAYFAPGMSGGPIVRQDGRVVGVVSASYERSQRTAYGAIMAGVVRTGMRLVDDHGAPLHLDFQGLIGHKLIDVGDEDVTWTGAGLEWSTAG
jgi:S1-C subfamily serine protease